MTKQKSLVASAVGLGLVMLSLAWHFGAQPATAQSGTRGGGVRQGGGGNGAARAGDTFESRFWNFLQQARYQNWAPAPGQNADPVPSQAPHGAFVKMYLNRTAIAEPDKLPHGSVIVKENYGPDGKALMAVTVMYRSQGYDPEHNDWYWVKYRPDGTVDTTPPEMGSMPVAGRFPMCIDCHSSADGKDFAYVND